MYRACVIRWGRMEAIQDQEPNEATVGLWNVKGVMCRTMDGAKDMEV